MSEWVRIVSWHLTAGLARPQREGWLPEIPTLCGRWAATNSEQTDDRPEGKTCETCLRIKVGR